MKSSAACVRGGALVLASACLAVAVRGQSPEEFPERRRPRSLEQQTAAVWEAHRREMERAKREMSRPRPPSGESLKPPPRREMTEEHKRLLYASPQERERFAVFLRQPRTGMMRLLVPGECGDDPRVVKAENSCLDAIPPVPGGGIFYSFAHGAHQAGAYSDLWLKGGLFYAGFAGGVLGTVTTLGDVPLEAVTPDSDGVEYLSRLVAPESLAEAQKQYQQNARGFRVMNYTYGMRTPAHADTTYVLRSIVYRESGNADKRRQPTDVLVAFRVIEKASDGSVTLLWRELQRRKSPLLKM